MPGLFSLKSLVLCDMQVNNDRLLLKTIKKFPKSPFRPAGQVVTFDKHQICSAITIFASTCVGFISLYLENCLWFCYV